MYPSLIRYWYFLLRNLRFVYFAVEFCCNLQFKYSKYIHEIWINRRHNLLIICLAHKPFKRWLLRSELNFVCLVFSFMLFLKALLLSMFYTFYVTKCRCDTMSEHRQFIIENDDFQRWMSRNNLNFWTLRLVHGTKKWKLEMTNICCVRKIKWYSIKPPKLIINYWPVK